MPRVLAFALTALVAAAVGFGAARLSESEASATEAHPAPLHGPAGGQDEAAGLEEGVARAVGALVDSVRAKQAALERIRMPQAGEEAALRRLPYRLHLDRGKALGVPPVGSDADLRRHLDAGRLVPLADNAYYTVKVLEHSSPFVTPETARLLAEVGRRFQAALAERGLPPLKYTISSVTRTAASQAALAEINRNATSGRSSHEFGTTVDIVYTKYQYAPRAEDRLDAPLPRLDAPLTGLLHAQYDALAQGYWEHLAGLMGRVLLEMQREQKVVVLLESRQPVFHITLWNPV